MIKFVRSTSEKMMVLLFVAMISCDTVEPGNSDQDIMPQAPEENQDFMLGSWDAVWKSNGDAFSLNNRSESMSMNGKIEFRENGRVQIKAYGFQGCIFLSDTMANELLYSIRGSLIDLMTQDDSFNLPHYEILNANRERVQLVTMDNIVLTLTR